MPRDQVHYDEDGPFSIRFADPEGYPETHPEPAPWPGQKKTLRARLHLWWAGVKAWWNFKLPNDIITWGQGK